MFNKSTISFKKYCCSLQWTPWGGFMDRDYLKAELGIN